MTTYQIMDADSIQHEIVADHYEKSGTVLVLYAEDGSVVAEYDGGVVLGGSW